MDIKNFLKYNHVDRYKFSIAPETNNNTFHESSTMKLYKYLDQNAQYIKNSFNYEINSDIIIREFLLNCRNVEYNAFIIYIDGMVSTDSINHFILNPLMLKNQNNTFNGMPLPNIWLRRADNTMQQLTDFGYMDFKERLGSRE